MAHPDLTAEQAHLDRAYERLETVRAETQAQLREAFSERGGTFQSYTERDIRVRNSLNRLEKLQLGREALIFGRIDRAGPVEPRHPMSHGAAAGTEAGERAGSGESFHIGRLAVSDRDHEPLVVDWRAPVAEPFYRATGAHPMGLRRRRHFLSEGRKLVDLEDELFEPGNPDGTAGGLGLSGPGVLMAALERAHTGRMRDIVATVQAEQDEIIRAPLAGALVVQGGPGTGKTAVALHRAAYLLYTHRFPLESQGVLVIGPNPTFLRYIDQVLPSLGETGVELSTATNLYRRARPTGAEDPPALARLKGGPSMATFLRRAVRQRQRPLRRTIEVPYGTYVLSLSPQDSQEIVSAAQRRSGHHNARRRVVEGLLWQHFAQQLESRQQRRASPATSTAGQYHDDDPSSTTPTTPAGYASPTQPGAPAAGTSPPGTSPHGTSSPGTSPPGTSPPGQAADEHFGLGPLTAGQLGAELRRRPEVAEALERMWPRLTPEDFLSDLLGAKPLIEHAGRGILTEAETALLYRPRNETSKQVAWSRADIALLDEASWLLGPSRTGRANQEPTRTYGHIVVDEAQDLTPMELRMVARRSLSGSMTLAGDIAQATGPWAPSSWDEVMGYLPARRGWSLATLSVSYRAPAEVMELAGRVLAAALPGTLPPEPVRRTDDEPRFVAAPAGIGPAVAGVVTQELSAVAAKGGGEDGSVGVLVPGELLADVRSALQAEGTPFGEVGAGALDAQVSLLAVGDAKGLEFDAVVVVEPARVVSGAPHGLRALYVALTRCTRRLAVVHREPLPPPLAPSGSVPPSAGRP